MNLKLTPDDITTIYMLSAAGHSSKVIAKQLSISPSGVRHHLQKRQRELFGEPVKRERIPKVHKCRGCPLIFTTNGHNPRVYCSPDCRAKAEQREIAHKLAEFRWIAGTDTWENIAHRLGYSNTDTLARFLFRHGEHEYARQVERVDIPTPRVWAA